MGLRVFGNDLGGSLKRWKNCNKIEARFCGWRGNGLLQSRIDDSVNFREPRSLVGSGKEPEGALR